MHKLGLGVEWEGVGTAKFRIITGIQRDKEWQENEQVVFLQLDHKKSRKKQKASSSSNILSQKEKQ